MRLGLADRAVSSVDNGDEALSRLTGCGESEDKQRMTARAPTTGFRKDPTWNFRSVGAFVPKATAKAYEAHGFHAAEIILNWAAIVGPNLAAYTVPRRIRWPKAPDRLGAEARAPQSGRGVKSALEIWVAGGRAHEMPYLKAPIIQRINAYFGYRAITDVVAVDGPVPQPTPLKPRRVVSPAELDAARQSAQLPADDPLADALARLGANIAKRKQNAPR